MIQSGKLSFTNSNPDGWTIDEPPLGSESDWRSIRSEDIQFPTRFSAAPTVILSLAGMSAQAEGGDLGVVLEAEDVQSEEFNVRIRALPSVDRVDVTWIAYD